MILGLFESIFGGLATGPLGILVGGLGGGMAGIIGVVVMATVYWIMDCVYGLWSWVSSWVRHISNILLFFDSFVIFRLD